MDGKKKNSLPRFLNKTFSSDLKNTLHSVVPDNQVKPDDQIEQEKLSLLCPKRT
jgi:hypothetical protein